MACELIRVGDLFAGAPYAYASIAQQGSLVFTAGACPIDDHGRVVGVGNYEVQAQTAVANLIEALNAADASLPDVLKTTVYVASADRRDLVSVWQVVRAAFGEHDAPSTLLGVSMLGYQDQLVEIEAVAMVSG